LGHAFLVAFALGAAAQRPKISPLVGYILAGVLVGPFTPGFVADADLAQELAEIGVILLMFGVGLHFSLKDLLAVRRIAIPGALGQMAVATLLGMGLAHVLGWTLTAGIVFGLALSVASTVVLLRALQERRLVQTDKGRIAVGWLIVEDLAMVLALVLLPALAGSLGDVAENASPMVWLKPLGITLLKVAAFVAFMLIVGRRVVPWVLHWVVHTGSRELFRLAVLAIALGFAFGSAQLFGVSFALGAFFAGMILAESELSHRAAEETRRGNTTAAGESQRKCKAARRAMGDGGAPVNGGKVTDAERLIGADDVLHGRVVVLRRGRKALAAGRLPETG